MGKLTLCGCGLLSLTFSDDVQPRDALKVFGVVSYKRVALLESRRCNPCVLGGYGLCPADEAHFTPPLADRMARGDDHVRRDSGFEALYLSSAPPRTIRTLVKLGYGHERDRQRVPFDVGPVSLSQGVVFEKEGKHVGIKQEIAHGLASSRSSRRRAYIPSTKRSNAWSLSHKSAPLPRMSSSLVGFTPCSAASSSIDLRSEKPVAYFPLAPPVVTRLEAGLRLPGRPTFDRRFMVAFAIVPPSSGSPRALGDLVEPSSSVQSSIERWTSHVESAGRIFLKWHGRRAPSTVCCLPPTAHDQT